MATLQTVMRLAFTGGTETRKQLEDIAKGGDAAKAAFDKMATSGAKIPASLRAVDAAASSVKGNIESLAASTGTLGAALSAIGGPVGVAALGVVGLGTAFTALTKKAFDVAGALVDASDATGIGIEQLQKYHIAAATAGVSAGEFDQAVQTLAKSVGQAQAGTGRLSKLLGTLDGDLLKNLKSATSTGEQFDLMAKKLASTESASQRVALATAAGGDAFAKLLPLLKDGENGFEEIGKSAEQAGAIMADKAVRAADDAGDKFTELALILEGQVNAAFIQSAPLIQNIAEAALQAIPSVVAFVNSFLPATSIEARLAEVRKQIFKAQDELVASEGSGPPGTSRQQGSFFDRLFGVDHAEEVKAKLDELIAKERELEAEASKQDAEGKKRTADRITQIRAEIEAAQKGAEAKGAQRKAEQGAAKPAREAEAAAKQATEAHKRGLEEVVKLEQDAQTAGLEGIELLEAKRDVAYAKFAELVKEDGLNQEEAARGYLAIWTAADREITAERQKESDKRAEKLAEEQAQALQRPLEEFADDIGSVLGDALVDFVHDGKIEFDDLWDGFLDAGLRAIANLVSQQISLNIVAAVTGQQQSGQLVNLFGTGSESGIFGKLWDVGKSLVNGIFGLTDATEAAATAFDVPVSGVAGSAATSGGEAAGGAAISGAAAGALGGILGVLGVAFGTAAAVDAVRRTRRFKFTEEAVFKEANKAAIDSEFGSLGKIIGADHSAAGFFLSNPKVGDRVLADVLTVGTAEIIRLAGLQAFKPPTGGTALRAGFEKFIESTGENGANVPFFSGNRFQRGIGQDATRELLRQRYAIPRGVKGFDGFSPPDGAFVVAMRDVIQAQKESIGLTDKQLQQFTGLAAAFRASVGKQAGHEEQRTLAIIADTLGSLEEGGVKAAEAMDLVGTAIQALGPPAEVFRKLNEFFTSGNNDIAVQDYANAVQGLAQVFFADVPLGVRAADLALAAVHTGAGVPFEELATRVTDVSAAAQLLVPVFQELTNAIAADPSSFFENGLVDNRAITDFHDAVLAAMKDATIGGFVQGMLQAVLEPTVLEPFTRTSRETIGKVTSGEISPEEGLKILKQAGIDAAASLDNLDPFIRQFIANVASLSDTFDGLSSSGKRAADTLDDVATPEKAAAREAFFQGINRQTLGILDPTLAARFDQEVQARQRLFDARALGIQEGTPEWVRIERLNELERNAIVEQAAEERTRIEEQAAEQIQRIIEQNTAEAKRALESVGEYVKQLTGSSASPLPPEVALANAQTEFNRLAAAARGGDLSAIEKLPEAGQNLLALAQSLFGSTDQFFALFGPTLDTLKEIAGLDPSSVSLSADARAQIDAINADRDETIKKLDKHHAEAMALWQAMLDALHIGPTGKGDETTGSTSGDQKSVPIVGGTAGQYGLIEVESRKLQVVLSGAKVGGDVQKDIQAMIAAGSFAGGKYGPLLAQLFDGAVSANGQLAVLHALDEKISNPRKVQPVLGFGTGGSFLVHGPGAGDIYPLPVRVAARETVTVTTHGMDQKLSEVVAALRQQTAEVVSLRREVAELRAQNTQWAGLDQQRFHRERAVSR